LKLKKYGKSIFINVHRGEYWATNPDFISKKNQLIGIDSEIKKMIKITEITCAPKPEDSNSKISIKLKDHSE
jgi:hypothetical protein